MDNKIRIQIFGAWNWVLSGGCSSGGCGGCSSKSTEGSSGCGGCSSKSGGCGNKTPKSMGELYEELVQSIGNSDVKDYAEFEFIDVRKINILDYDDVRYLYDEGYELPYCVIDSIVRYYGGIVSSLIYKDIKELIDDRLKI